MSDQQIEWIITPALAWEWAMGWVNGAKLGSHRPVKNIRRAAADFEERFCTNGLWSPGAELVHTMLCEAADMAQGEYENAQPSMED